MADIKEGYLIDYVSGQPLKATPEEVQAVQPFVKKARGRLWVSFRKYSNKTSMAC